MAIVLAVVGLVLLIPRPNAAPRTAVDVDAALAAADDRLPFELAVPRYLPDGWVLTAAGLIDGMDGVPTWTLTYRTPSGGWVGLRQGIRTTARWEQTQVVGGPEHGTIYVGSRVWIIRDTDYRGVRSVVLHTGELTTVVTGRAPLVELQALITHTVLPDRDSGAVGSGLTVPRL